SHACSHAPAPTWLSTLSLHDALPISHRGYHDMNKTRWENTLSAARAAIERNYAIECDVHLSSDGVPVVFHDSELERLTGQKGFRSEEHTSELQSRENLVCRLLLEKKK